MSDDLFPPETAPMFGASRRAQCVVCSRVALLPYPNVELGGPCIDDEEAQLLRAQRGYDDLAEQINIASQEWFAMVVEMPIEQTERWLRIVTAIMLGEAGWPWTNSASCPSLPVWPSMMVWRLTAITRVSTGCAMRIICAN